MSNSQRSIFSRSACHKLCKTALSAKTLSEACEVIKATANTLPSFTLKNGKRVACSWRRDLLKLASGLQSGDMGFLVFAKGNTKLPFYNFSTLPQYTCPGAGVCLRFCYSFKAWRYPSAFARQLQNTLLLKFAKRVIAAEFETLPADSIFRLYVDGDFDSLATLGFWFRLLTARRDIICFGYSKSWNILTAWNAQGLPFPGNYVLNVSSGSRYDDDRGLQEAILALPCSRGVFAAVSTVGKHAKGFKRYDSKAYHADIRNSARLAFGVQNPFSCTGKCDKCLPNGVPACGSVTMSGVVIANGTH